MPADQRLRSSSLPRQPTGAILLESLVALTLISVCAAGTFIAFDRLEETSRALRKQSADNRAQASRAETASLR